MSYSLPGEIANKAGVVWLEVTVSEQGKPIACRVILSSGTAELDQQICASIKVRGRFDPGRDDQGHPIAGVHRRRILWNVDPKKGLSVEMPADATVAVNRLPAGAKSYTLLKVIEDENGGPESCSPEASSGNPQLDAAACSLLMKAHFPDIVRDSNGKPVKAIRIRKVAFSTDSANPARP